MRTILLAGVIALSMAEVAAANERKPDPGVSSLPGVDTVHTSRETPPLDDPIDRSTHGADAGYMRIGNWEVRISGSVSYQIGIGTDRERR